MVGQVLTVDDPQRVGPYQLLARLGSGGMGQVYLGQDSIGRLAAVKLIHSAYLEVPDFRRRFAAEINIATRARAPWTVKLLDADAHAPLPWMATEFVPGPSLQQAVDRLGPLPEDTVGILGSRLADALAALHSAGLVHRDLKPSNVILAGDGPRLLDFGIATALDATRITRTGTVVGTPAFMSPEQCRGETVGPPSDVFSLAAVLTFAATGHGPFQHASNPVVMLRRVTQDPPDLTALPDRLRDEVAPCLAKDPAGRPSTRQLAHTMAHWTDHRHQPWLPPAVSELTDHEPPRRPDLDPARHKPAPVAPTQREPAPPADAPAGLTPTATVLRHISQLVRTGRRPPATTLALLALPLIAAPLLAIMLWQSATSHRGLPISVPDAGRRGVQPSVPDTAASSRAVLLGSPAVIGGVPRPGALTVSPDSTRVYVVGSLHELAVIDTDSHRLLQFRAFPPDTLVEAVFCSPDGRWVYLVEDKKVEIVDAATGRTDGTVPLPHNAFSSKSALSADGTRLAISADNNGAVTVIDTTTRAVRADYPLPKNLYFSVAVNTDGTRAYLAPVTGPLLQVDLVSGQQRRLEAVNDGPEITASPDGRQIYVQQNSGVIDTLDATSGEVFRRTATTPWVGTLLAARSGHLIAVHDVGEVQVLDPTTGAVVAASQVGQTIDFAAVAPDTRQIIATTANDIIALPVTVR